MLLELSMLLVLAASPGTANFDAPSAFAEPAKKRTIDQFRGKTPKTLTPAQALAQFGKPDREPGSGLIIYEYDLADGSKVILGFPGFRPVIYARHAKADGTVDDLLPK